MAERNKSGWWLAFIAAFSIITINVPTQIIRTSTLDYLVGVVLATALLAFLLIFKSRLVDENQSRD
ncbi:MAG: hypothetical protein ACTSO6_13085 [Promethearchaeota archaeon]